MAKQWSKVDNSATDLKARLRIRNLPEKPAVLDLFCGTGQMYQAVYKDRAILYHGVDREKVHDPKICTLADNLSFLTKSDINQFNVFDLDDYGCPWKQIYLIFRKLHRPDATLFVTDGLVMHQKVDGKVTKFVSATENLPKNFNIPGLNRWYVDIFATMLLDIEKRFGWKTVKAEYCHNSRRSVYYWAIKLLHIPTIEKQQHKKPATPALSKQTNEKTAKK